MGRVSGCAHDGFQEGPTHRHGNCWRLEDRAQPWPVKGSHCTHLQGAVIGRALGEGDPQRADL